jgi:hypothetical protein
MKVFFEESFIRISYDQELNTVFSEWLTAPTSEEFRQGMNQMIEAFKEFNTGILMSNTANIGAIDPDDQEWSTTDWIARALPAGYKQFAVITSPDIFAQMSVEDTLTEVQLANSTLKIQYFDNEADARQWIKESN